MRVLRGCRVWMGVDGDRGPRSSPPGGGLVVPSLTSLAKLAAALDVTVADLVIGDSKRDRLYDLTRSMAEREVAVVLKKAEDLAGDRTAKK
jgi:hypothetical protein